MLRFRIGLCFALLAGLFAGCTANPNAPARISGIVTYKGNPLPAGSIAFVSDEQGHQYGGPLSPDGSYEVRDLPTGPMIVTVETEYLKPEKKAPDYGGGKGAKMYAERVAVEGKGGAAAAKAPPEQYVKIPAKYGNSKTSPLTITIESGRQVKNFDLVD
jgi:hypothetical protein